MFKIGVLGHRFEIKYILWHTTLTRDQNGRTLLVVLHAQIQSWGNKKLDGGLDWNSDLKRTLMQHPIVVRLFLLCSFLRSEIQIYLIVAAKIFKILSNFSSLFFSFGKKILAVVHWSQTKFLEGVGSPELNRGVSKCVEQFFARELLTWFPLKEDAKEVTVLFETLRDTLLLVVIVHPERLMPEKNKSIYYSNVLVK